MTRWRLIPTLSTHGSKGFTYGDEPSVRAEGEAKSAEIGCRVLLVHHPEGGLIREVGMVGQDPPKPKRGDA